MLKERDSYATFEKIVLYLYDQGLLTLDLLDYIAGHYRQVGTGSAGCLHMRSQDGWDLQQICIELIDPTFPLAAIGSSGDHEEYWEREQQKWEEIVHKRWSWHTSRV